MHTRVRRIQKLGLKRELRNKIFRGVIVTCSHYATNITGLSDGGYDKITQAAHQGIGPATGRSSFARLMLSGGQITGSTASHRAAS